MRLTDQLRDYTNAAFTGVWVQTQEPDEAEREILQMARDRKWRIAVWDIAQGLRVTGANPDAGAGDPIAAIKALPGLAHTTEEDKGTTILLLHNFHRFLASPEVMQTTFAQLIAGKDQRAFLVVLSPIVQIPVELEKLFVARTTGDTLATIERLGFREKRRSRPDHPTQEDPLAVIDCPCCGGTVVVAWNRQDELPELAECRRCETEFPYADREVYEIDLLDVAISEPLAYLPAAA